MVNYEGVIGLEVHIQLKTKSKMFCSCAASYGALPNTQVCPVCLGMPGTLPVINKTAIEYAMKLALALNAKINLESQFARKNYFYPDLPKGYQISQFEIPLARDGYVRLGKKTVRIREIHLEEEAGKSIHDSAHDCTLVDYNRCGVPLIEIVTEPDMNSSDEAYAFLHKIKQLAEYLDITTGNMQEGALRWDVNVSIRKPGEIESGARHEIKNMNSFRFAVKAIDYEIESQSKTRKSGQKITHQTMLYNEAENITRPMRVKEGADDYRYFPEPDLPPLIIDEKRLGDIRRALTELPETKHRRFIADYNLRDDQALALISTRQLADYFEATVEAKADSNLAANWIINECPREMKEGDLSALTVMPSSLAELMNAIESEEISAKAAKDVFAEMLKSGKSPREIIEKSNLTQISDRAYLRKIIEKVLSESEDNIKLYLSGKTGLFGYFVGEAIKATEGKANPKIVNELLTELLSEIKDSNA